MPHMVSLDQYTP